LFLGFEAFIDATEQEIQDPRTNANVKPPTAAKRKRNTP
jgi:hypothetical protein